MGEVVLRTATPEDVSALLELWEVAAENDGRPTGTTVMIERLLACDPESCVVAELDGRLAGSVVAGWDGWRAHPYRLAVHPRRAAGSATRRSESCMSSTYTASTARRIWSASGSKTPLRRTPAADHRHSA